MASTSVIGVSDSSAKKPDVKDFSGVSVQVNIYAPVVIINTVVMRNSYDPYEVGRFNS
jgi:hypothetical protein